MAVTTWFKALILWFAILILAVLNGALRETALIPVVGPVGGLIISGALLSCAIFTVAFLAVPWYGRLPSWQFWLVGLFWFAFTLLFEVGVGLAQHQEWSELVQAYTFKGGNIWPVVLVVVLVSPVFAARLRGFVQ
jgi:hypothetical protein